MKGWEQAAIRELLDVVYTLVNGGFERKQELLNRLTLSREGIDLLETDEAEIDPKLSDKVAFLQPRIGGRDDE